MNAVVSIVLLAAVLGVIVFLLSRRENGRRRQYGPAGLSEFRTDLALAECFDRLDEHNDSDVFVYDCRRERDGGFLLHLSRFNPVSFLATAHVEVIRSTPVVVQVFIIYYGIFSTLFELPSIRLFGFIRFERFFPGVVALAMNSGAYLCEIIRSGIQSIDGGQMVKKDTVINLRVSKGPEEAATPVVTNLTQDQAVLQDEQVTLSISAYASDNGALRYAWYMSTDGGYENAALVSRSREGNTTCAADTSVPGTYYYFCVVENSLGDDTKTTKSNMIEVVVQEKTVEKTIEVNLPSKSGLYEITVYVDGVLQYGPASVSITDDRSVIVEVTVRGKGTLPVDVYLDGAIYDSQLILFE